MIATPEVLQTAPRHTATLRLAVAPNEMQKVMGPALGEVRAAVQAQGLAPTGPWFTHHFPKDGANFDFEICVPVFEPFIASGRVMPGEWPATRVARTIYPGPFQGLGAAWGELDAWIEANGLKRRSDLYECYVSGPESSPDPTKWKTELSRPLLG